MSKFKAFVALAAFAAAVGTGVLASMAPGAAASSRATAPALTATPEREAVAPPAAEQPAVGPPAAVIPVRTGNDQWMWIVPVSVDSVPAAPENAAGILVEV
ncbi:hypothetical protein [Streptomyces sp. NBC_01435]|uniref:hypothetical protein n=1 Tax=Streptomyces sp. NBC_01435 TaxID=2903865 RepID=UPI002E313F99|nr:hypothetical protein [Streptomyces sp. NBC_01435]